MCLFLKFGNVEILRFENVENEMAVYGADDESGEWTTHIDEESGDSYQYNSVTGESVWDEA